MKDLLPEADKLFEKVRRDGVVQNFEAIGLTKDGRTITVELTQTLLAENTVESWTSSLIMRDITTRREQDAIVEEERVRIARDLHDSVAQVLYLLALKADMASGQVALNPDQVKAARYHSGVGASRRYDRSGADHKWDRGCQIGLSF